jgi:hypothetical protein
MSGPIVRTGTNPKFWANWDKAFGAKKSPAKPAVAKKTKSTKSPAKRTGKK